MAPRWSRVTRRRSLETPQKREHWAELYFVNGGPLTLGPNISITDNSAGNDRGIHRWDLGIGTIT
jgi:hypothetical protein